jgi:cytosine/adenosine deaminase-related metal-dependent hydrolase
LRQAPCRSGQRSRRHRHRGGRIVDIAPRIAGDAAQEELDGRLAIPGFVEATSLDKSCIPERCPEHGSLQNAIAAVAAKRVHRGGRLRRARRP